MEVESYPGIVRKDAGQELRDINCATWYVHFFTHEDVSRRYSSSRSLFQYLGRVSQVLLSTHTMSLAQLDLFSRLLVLLTRRGHSMG